MLCSLSLFGRSGAKAMELTMAMTKLSTWCLYLCLCPAMFRSVRAQASYWERTDCGPNALTTQDFVSCLLSEPDCVRDCDIFFTSSGESCEEEKAEMCFLYQACCPACDAQYQQWFGMCGNLVARHGNNCICPKTAPVAPPPSVNEVFTTPPRPTPMPVTRSPTTTFCDEMKIDYSMCRIQNYRECGDCEKPTNFSAFSSCDLAKDDLCTHNSGCCDECEKQYLDWINQCTLPLFGSDCRCENWSPPTPPTDAPTSEPLRIDLNPWPDDFQISAEPGTYVVTKASLDLESLDFDDAPPEFYQELVFGIQSNVPTTLYYHKKMYLHGHPLHPPFLEEAEDLRCDPWSSRTFANIAVISDCELQPDIQVEIGGRRDVLKFSITSTEMSNNTVFFEPSTFSGRWSCPKGKPIYCTSASINLSFFWTAFLVFLSTAASIVAPLPFLSQNRRIWWGACTGIVVWTASTQTKIFSKALSTSSEKMCNVNLEIITNACLGLYESSGVEVSENVRIYEITESGLELYQDRICSSGFPVSSSPVDGVEVDACNDCGYCPTGRPFRDYKDKIVLAASQNADASSKSAWSTDPQLPHDQYGTRSTSASLSEEWTHRAIGEHASIASFASFVIALMANQAPPHLIQRALLAAMDELNHATISFTVASILLGDGTNIEPGPLPSSTLTFSKNLTALGIATAREGCIDETLSALVLAEEVSQKVGLWDQLDSLEQSILEATCKIAEEEGNHAVLAWQTIQWICQKEASACRAIEQAFHEDSSRVSEMTGSSVYRSWQTILNAMVPFVFKGDTSPASTNQCSSREEGPLLFDMDARWLSEEILDRVLCDFRETQAAQAARK